MVRRKVSDVYSSLEEVPLDSEIFDKGGKYPMIVLVGPATNGRWFYYVGARSGGNLADAPFGQLWKFVRNKYIETPEMTFSTWVDQYSEVKR